MRGRGAGVANGTRYRYIGDEPLENAGSAGAGNAGANAGTTAAAKTRSRPNSEYVLYSNGEPVAVNSDNGVSYFGTDILGSVRSVTDRNGQVKTSYEYDAFGTPYLSNLENDVGFGYCGKVYDSATGLYDYGFRDYAPNSARFTTVDPVRDGANWFSYVVNDPVNYVDSFGLEATDSRFGGDRKTIIINGPGNVSDIEENYLNNLNNRTPNPNIEYTTVDNAAELNGVINNAGNNVDYIITGTHGAPDDSEIGTSDFTNRIHTNDLNITTDQSGNRLFLDTCLQGNYLDSWSSATNIDIDNIYGNNDARYTAPSVIFINDVCNGQDILNAWNEYQSINDTINNDGNIPENVMEEYFDALGL